MTTLLALVLACAQTAAAQKPAPKTGDLPDAPSAVVPAQDAETDARVRQALRDAVFLPKPLIPLPTFEETQRLPKLELPETVGHRDVTAQAQSQPRGYAFDAMPYGAGLSSRTKTESVELSFAQPAPGVTLGVGYSERKEWMGNYRAPSQSAAFAVLRITLGPSAPKPALFLPEARVSKRTDFQGEKVEHYSIDDLPPGLRP
jgi:hypothetical protein